MDNRNSMSRIHNKNIKKSWNPFANHIEQPSDPNFPAQIAEFKFVSGSGFPKNGTLRICKLSDGTYNFLAKNVDAYQRYWLNHVYWNGYKQTEEQVGPQTSVTKTKHGLTRGVVGGAVAGPFGALIGAGTAKKETKAYAAKTKIKKEPLNAYLILTNIKTGQVIRVEMNLSIMGEMLISKFENTFQLTHETEYTQSPYNNQPYSGYPQNNQYPYF